MKEIEAWVARDKDGKIYVYDISVIKDGVKIQPDGKVKVTVSVPEIDTGKTYTVYHIKQDGAVEKIKPTVQSGKVVFETDGFSCFIIAPDDTSSVGGVNEPTKKQVNVSINILPLAAYGLLMQSGAGPAQPGPMGLPRRETDGGLTRGAARDQMLRRSSCTSSTVIFSMSGCSSRDAMCIKCFPGTCFVPPPFTRLLNPYSWLAG